MSGSRRPRGREEAAAGAAWSRRFVAACHRSDLGHQAGRRGGVLAPLSHLHAAARLATVTCPAPRRP